MERLSVKRSTKCSVSSSLPPSCEADSLIRLACFTARAYPLPCVREVNPAGVKYGILIGQLEPAAHVSEPHLEPQYPITTREGDVYGRYLQVSRLEGANFLQFLDLCALLYLVFVLEEQSSPYPMRTISPKAIAAGTKEITQHADSRRSSSAEPAKPTFL